MADVEMHATDLDEVEENGAEVEKWILRVLLLGVLGALTAAVLGSLDDIKRYVHMQQM